MKKITSIVFLFLFSCVSQQPLPTPDAKIYDLKGIKKSQIFPKTLQWISENFHSANNIIQYKDLAEGKIICQAASDIRPTMDMYQRGYYFTWIIEIKDEKMKIEYKNISPLSVGEAWGVGYWDWTKEAIDKDMLSMSDRLLLYVKQETKKTEW